MQFSNDFVQAVTLVGAIVMTVYGLLKALALFFGFVGGFWAPALRWAEWCATADQKVHLLGVWITSFIPSTPAAAMKAARKHGPPVAAFVAVFVGGGAVLLGCGWLKAHPAVEPDAQALEECVEGVIAKDAENGETDLQVAVDVGVACGPEAVNLIEASVAKRRAHARLIAPR